jgi:redox-sensitive bicupin YhaK (pirin superfamily)
MTPAMVSGREAKERGTIMSDLVKAIRPLGGTWETADPFIFCAYHDDHYPAGNELSGPAASLEGRDIGQDFAAEDGWRMYHGDVVPGFPGHPHRGFETVTVVTEGIIDHADSLGAAGRYGAGDVQWLTTGRGVQHSEMFPLLDQSGPNHLELFQIWLNLPSESKMAEPHFTMLWRDQVPRHIAHDEAGRTSEIRVIAGQLGDLEALAPPPASWANRPDAHVAIWTITMEPGARWTLPPSVPGVNRTLYFYRGGSLEVAGVSVRPMHSVALRPDGEVLLRNEGETAAELLLLQGRPIGEPIAQYGPFVMNSPDEIQQAFADYRRTEFGGWPWPVSDPVHPRDETRFARHADGEVERPS